MAAKETSAKAKDAQAAEGAEDEDDELLDVCDDAHADEPTAGTSRTIVTGPSPTIVTSMSAPKRPQATSGCWWRAR